MEGSRHSRRRASVEAEGKGACKAGRLVGGRANELQREEESGRAEGLKGRTDRSEETRRQIPEAILKWAGEAVERAPCHFHERQRRGRQPNCEYRRRPALSSSSAWSCATARERGASDSSAACGGREAHLAPPRACSVLHVSAFGSPKSLRSRGSENDEKGFDSAKALRRCSVSCEVKRSPRRAVSRCESERRSAPSPPSRRPTHFQS
eukprot:6211053-Pleurochrysis_carterae.AAC.2